jgi:hypothetical protein
MAIKGVDMGNIQKMLTWFYIILFLTGLTILPWWLVYKLNEKLDNINHLQTYNESLRNDNEKILAKLLDTIEARDLYANKYCLAVNFSTTECKQLLKEKIKREVAINSEIDLLKKQLTQNSPDK